MGSGVTAAYYYYDNDAHYYNIKLCHLVVEIFNCIAVCDELVVNSSG